MTGSSTRYRPVDEDRPNHDGRLKHSEHDYYSSLRDSGYDQPVVRFGVPLILRI